MNSLISRALLTHIKTLLQDAQQNCQQSINTTMVQSYWHIGRLIVEDELQGKARAAYGKQQLAQLAKTLSDAFGKGFDARNLHNMRKFYPAFPIWQSVNAKLSWSHYVRLIRTEDQQTRDWYISESIANNWSAIAAHISAAVTGKIDVRAVA